MGGDVKLINPIWKEYKYSPQQHFLKVFKTDTYPYSIFLFLQFQLCMFSPVISMLAERAKDVSSLLQSDVHSYINILHFFAKHTVLAEVIAYLFCGNFKI